MERENGRKDEVGVERGEFMPLAFAARTGKWGEKARGLFKRLEEEGKRKGISADQWGWNAMRWSKHWKQRIGVTLARGRGQVVMAELRAKGEREGQRSGERGWATQEWDTNVGGGPPAAVLPKEKSDMSGGRREEAEKGPQGKKEKSKTMKKGAKRGVEEKEKEEERDDRRGKREATKERGIPAEGETRENDERAQGRKEGDGSGGKGEAEMAEGTGDGWMEEGEV